MNAFLPRSLRRYRKFFADVITVATGRAAVVAIKLAVIPVVARLFTPEHFGIMAVVLGVAALAGSVATLRYERAIVLPASDREAERLAWLTAVLFGGACSVLAFAAAVLVIAPEIAPRLSGAGPWILVVPAAVALLAIVQILEAWATRAGRFPPIAQGEIGQTLLTGASRIGFGLLWGSTLAGLFLSFLLGLAGKVVLLLRGMRGLAPQTPRPPRADLISVAKQYKDFPLHNAPTAFVRDLSNQLPTFALALLYAPAVAGFFAMASRLVWPFVNIGAVALRRVFIQRLARYRNNGASLLRPSLLATAAMAAIGTLPFGALWLAGERLVPFLLGENWRVAGEFVSLLAPLYFVGWTSTPAGALLVLLRRQDIGLRIHLYVALARAAAFVYAAVAGLGAADALLAYAGVSIAGNLALIACAAYLVSRDDANRPDRAADDVIGPGDEQ